ncbi:MULTISPECIES: YitT family protein [unclassified Microbacterium]|uniref:membrane protein YczE n=1 Tax=unclassified Microbacterium TaxID=2609290 RepID=UPI00386AD2ED
MTRRLIRLLIGLTLYGIGCALLVQAGIGLDPWTVLAEGLSLQTGIGIGWVVVILGAVVLLLWIPLRQRPGVGTIANILVVGTVMQGALAVIPPVRGFVFGTVVFLVGIAMIAIASAIYIGTRLGPGPRDGLMIGLNTRFGWPIWFCRFVVEGTVLLLGWLLGGTLGLGTVLFAVLIGPAVHLAMDVSARLGARRPSPTPAGPRSPVV